MARSNRDAAFGHSTRKRTWIGDGTSAPEEATGSRPESPTSSEAPGPQASQRGHGRRAAFPIEQLDDRQGAPVGDAHDAWSHPEDDDPSAGAPPQAADASAASASAGPDATATSVGDSSGSGSGGSGESGSGGGSGSGDPEEGSGTDGEDPRRGSLPKVAFWTVLTSLVPGSGLLPTRLRRYGVLLLGLLLLVIAALGAVLLQGDPLRTLMMIASFRGALIGLMIAVGVLGVVWALQIVAANLAHSRRERLQGARRYLALALAALMVVGVVLPFGRGVQSLWALQGLVGSDTVFGGGDGQNHPFTDGEDPWADTERLNFLLLGQDAGADRTGTRPDTIMVASVDTETGKTALFSIPRNLEKVEFPEGTVAAEEFPDGFDYYGPNQSLINAVWTWAEEHPDLFPGDPTPGLTATTWAVEETLGLETDYYAMVNLQGFEDMVDALGGVDLVVERRIPIGGGASEVEGYIEPGEQKLDGFDALWYARSREGSNDFDRMCRQQRIVRAVAEEADPSTLALSIPGLVTATEKNIQTDIPVSDLNAFADLALRIKEGGFTSYPITQDVTFSGDPDFEYLEVWVQDSIDHSMETEEPESVMGETEPGSTEPAETADPAPEESSAEESTPGEATPTEEETTEEETPTAEETTEADGAEEETEATEIEEDPLQSCLPGAEQEG
ncbi:LCP family protein [Brachybacterium sp. YJGR34]|uniref:LCP family protein n=1 Tax=Brachybacterium sp. YJGR34 TaxID=2059911 RepID=UPI001E4AF2BE|nr:LCP family protein [Brachybacterium sp. YJGR34]